MSGEGGRTTGRRAGFSSVAAVVAFVTGFFLAPLCWFIVANELVGWTLLLLVLVGVLGAGSVWLAPPPRPPLALVAFSAPPASGGREGVGKPALALRLAQALKGEGAVGAGAPTYGGDERAAGPCGECKPCRRIAG